MPVLHLIDPIAARKLTHTERQERTQELLRRASGLTDPEERQPLLDEVVLLNMRVAEALSRHYLTSTVALEDLVQVAYGALVRAVRQFDASRDADLLTYAVPSIRGELRRHLRDHGWTIRPPRDIQRAHTRLSRIGLAADRYTTEQLSEISEKVGETAQAVGEAIAARQFLSLLSLDRPVGIDQGETVGELVADENGESTSRQATVELRMVLRPLLADLSPRDREIVRLRFTEELSQRAIAEKIGLSQMQVSRILARVLRELRAALGEDMAYAYAS